MYIRTRHRHGAHRSYVCEQKARARMADGFDMLEIEEEAKDESVRQDVGT